MVIINAFFIFITLLASSSCQIRQVRHSNTLNFIPNVDQTYQLISAVNVPALERLISNLKQLNSRDTFEPNSILCEKQTLLINQIIGLMNIAVWRNTLKGAQSIIQVQQYDKKIKIINDQIIQLKKQQRQAQKNKVQLDIEGKLENLQRIYRQYKQHNNNITRIFNKIAYNSQRSQSLMSNINQHKSIIAQKQLQKKLTQIQIQKLQDSIKLLQTKNQQLNTQIIAQSNVIIANQYQLTEISVQNQELENDIHEIQVQKQRINKQILDLEFSIPKIQQQIKQLTQTINVIQLRIQQAQQLKQQLQQQYQQLQKPSEISLKRSRLITMIQQYHKLIIEVQVLCFAPDSQYYEDNLTKIIKGQFLSIYLRNMYSQNTILPQSILPQSYLLQYIDLYGLQWTQKYGFPFSEQEISQENQLLIQNDLTCKQTDINDFQSKNGVLVLPTSRIIYVRDQNNRNIRLKIGACTKIQCDGKLPSAGKTIYFKGIIDVQNSNESWQEWQTYLISCYK